MTEAPPPATIVQMRPCLLRTVNFSEAPDFASNSEIIFSASKASRPKGGGKFTSPPQRDLHWKSAVASNFAAMSKMKIWFLETTEIQKISFILPQISIKKFFTQWIYFQISEKCVLINFVKRDNKIGDKTEKKNISKLW